jgi:hypothetical protein
MKIAICLSGGIKFPQHSLDSINNILPNDNVKIFIHSWQIDSKDKKKFVESSWTGVHHQDELFAHSTLGIVKNLSTHFDVVDYVYENFADKSPLFSDIFNSLKWVKYERNDFGIISMYYSLFQSNLLKKKYEKENNMKFEKVVRMRFDSNFFGKKINLESFIEPLNIPIGRDFTGINDQFAVCSSSHMDIYSNVFSELSKTVDAKYHPESILKKHLENYGILPWRFPFHVGINNKPESDRGY